MSDTRQNIIFLVLGLSILEASWAPNYYLLAGCLSLTLIPAILIHFISQGWITSKGNEWLLIIQNGELKRAGVGLKTFKFWNQVAVKFPSTINGVTFEAAQVTSENFGIQIKGVVYWAVYRQGDGPFKCYKYIQGTNANENVKQMTESIVRSQISNTKLLEVLKNRHALREAVTTNLRQSLEGWGIWAETVEITEVIISSNQTFKDMQTEFRFTHKQLALKANQETGQKLEAQRQKFNLQKTTIQSDLQTKYIEKEQEENLKREEQMNNFKKKEIEFKKEQLLQKKELEICEKEAYHKEQMKLQENQDLLTKLKFEFRLKNETLDREVENTMNDQNKQLLALKSAKNIYDSMNYNLQGIKVNQYSGPKEIGNLAQVLPSLNMLNQVIQQESSN